MTDLEGIKLILEGLTAFVDSEILPLEEKNAALLNDPRQRYDESGQDREEVTELRREVRRRSSSAGFYTMCVPKELGGGGQGPLLHFMAWESLFSAYGPKRRLPYDVIAHWARGPSHIMAESTPSVAQAVLPALMAGEKSICFSLSEPDAGSDAWNLRTRADLVDGRWVINGTKQWSTNGATADYALVFAITDPEAAKKRSGGVTAFMVSTDTPGFRVDSTITLFGSIGGDEAIISLNDVTIPYDSHIGQIDNGFAIVLAGISQGRMYNAGRAIGLSRWALEKATEYATQRKTFGTPISQYQAIQFLLADAAINIYTSRCIALDCAHRLEKGQKARKELSIVKAFTTEAAFRTLDGCMQIFGAMGFTTELGLYDAWHTARIARIADGSAEIMRRAIAKQLLQGDLNFT